MNTTLLIANAIALAVLLGFQLVQESPEPLAQRLPHYLQTQKAAQWAVLSNQSGSTLQTGNDPKQLLPAQTTERLVF
ncbi:hypothetical protein [Pseudomonas sp. EA_5y_Pfl2_R50]|jgi:hypothetical protein|uniref:hypothetical protein n=1 Tax=Pseudomonas sp. EA_5y_Pfl2_R50 TaxID=3088691 RepID=UPI0030DCF3F8